MFSKKTVLFVYSDEWAQALLPCLRLTYQTLNQTVKHTLAHGCLQLQADWGYIYDWLGRSHHILFLISHPCNPVWHKDGCWCWLWSNMEHRTRLRQIPIAVCPLLDNKTWKRETYTNYSWKSTIKRELVPRLFKIDISWTVTHYTEGLLCRTWCILYCCSTTRVY